MSASSMIVVLNASQARDAEGDAMNILFVLISLSLALLGVAVWALFWAVDTGQFENLDEAARAYEDDADVPEAK